MEFGDSSHRYWFDGPDVAMLVLNLLDRFTARQTASAALAQHERACQDTPCPSNEQPAIPFTIAIGRDQVEAF
jgi:hypothetical protein